jgi:hypothetical protein
MTDLHLATDSQEVPTVSLHQCPFNNTPSPLCLYERLAFTEFTGEEGLLRSATGSFYWRHIDIHVLYELKCLCTSITGREAHRRWLS